MEGVLHIPQSSKTGASPLDCFVSYSGHSLWVLALYRYAVGLFYSPSCLGLIWFLCLMAYHIRGLFKVKAIILEEQQWCYLTPKFIWEYKGVHTFSKGICPKVNVIARLEFELANYNSAVHRFNHYTTKTSPPTVWVPIITSFLHSFYMIFFINAQ